MPLQIDDLRVGQWIAVEHDLTADDRPDFNPFTCHRPPKSRVDGMPLKIVSISLPFIAVTDQEARFVIDTRDVKLCRLSKHFVKAMTSTDRQETGHGSYLITNKRAAASVPEAKPERACPVCSERLHELYREGVWLLACPECGFCGGRGATN